MHNYNALRSTTTLYVSKVQRPTAQHGKSTVCLRKNYLQISSNIR